MVVQGRVVGTFDAAGYQAARGRIRATVLESFQRLAADYDLIIVEGAGSPAEVNLRSDDIANMGFARAAGVPVCLVGDVDCGGVIAALVGTGAVLDPEDAALIVGFAVNKFRGDPALFANGLAIIERLTGWRCFGLIHWLAATGRLPAEDTASVSRDAAPGGAGDRAGTARQRRAAGSRPLCIVAPMLSRLANFDRRRPSTAGSGHRFLVRAARPAHSARCGRGGAVRHEIDGWRAGVPASAGVGSRRHRARADRRPGAGAVRRISDAGPARSGSGGCGRPARRCRRTRSAGCRDDDGRREDCASGRRSLCAHRRAGVRVRDSHGADTGTGARPSDAASQHW